MWEKFVTQLIQATQEIVGSIAQFLPHLVATLVIIAIGWLLAYALRALLRSILQLVKFDRLSQDAGASQLLKKADLPSSSELLSRLVFWVAWVGIIMAGVSILGIGGLQPHISRFFGFLPRLFTALFVFFFGSLAANFFSRSALLGAVNADLPSPRLISMTVRTLIFMLTISMGFEELGLAENTVLLGFGIVFGSLMLGLALAFGIGGQDLARRYLESRFVHEKRVETKDDELSPL